MLLAAGFNRISATVMWQVCVFGLLFCWCRELFWGFSAFLFWKLPFDLSPVLAAALYCFLLAFLPSPTVCTSRISW